MSSAYGSLPIRTANPGDVVVALATPTGSGFGTASNPLYVTGGTGGSSSTVGTQAVSGAVSLIGTSAVSGIVTIGTALPSGGNKIGNVGLVDATNTAFGTLANPIYVLSNPASGTQNVDVLNTVAVSGVIGIDQSTPGANNVLITGVASVQLFDGSSNPFGTSGNPLYVDVSNSSAPVGTQAVSGTITIGTALPSGANLIGSVDVANTVAVSGTVNIGGGIGSSSLNPLYVSTGAGTSGTLYNSGQLHAASLAPGANITLATTPFSANTVSSLTNLVVSGSAAARFDFQNVDATGTATTLFSLFTTAAQPNATFKPYVDGEIISGTADGVNAKYQIVVNNIDTVATDFYAYIAWSQP